MNTPSERFADGATTANMRDPFNPTPEELRRWAYDPDSQCMEDWELLLLGLGLEELFYELASDPECPNRQFFLLCLDSGINIQARDYSALEPWLSRAEKSGDPLLRSWSASWRRTIQ